MKELWNWIMSWFYQQEPIPPEEEPTTPEPDNNHHAIDRMTGEGGDPR